MALRYYTTPEPGHCLNMGTHLWRLLVETFDVIVDGAKVAEGTVTKERCSKCGATRAFAPDDAPSTAGVL